MPETLATRAGLVTPKERKFVKAYVETGNITKAAQLAYDVACAGTASSLGHHKLRNSRVQREVDRVVKAINLKSIDDNAIRASIADTAFGSKSEAVKFKGRELLAKVYGLLDESPKFQQNIQLNDLNVDLSDLKDIANALTQRLRYAVKVVPVPQAEPSPEPSTDGGKP